MSRFPYDGFDNWTEVQLQFGTTTPEPEEVILAEYEQEYYEGRALVIYRNGPKYYLNYGSHCSCYGLENQWGPEEYESREQLVTALKRGNWDLWDDALRALKEPGYE